MGITMSVPAYGIPDNGYDSARQNAERIHDDARAEAQACIAEEVDAACDRIVEWVQKNTVNSLDAASVRRMKKELEIGVRRGRAAPRRG